MSEREAYQEKYAAQLKIWEAEMAKLKAQAEKANAEAKAEYYRQLDELYEQQAKAKEHYEAMVEANERAWQDLRSKSEAAWKDMSDGIKSAWSRFR